tara:strand:+ start:1994 stop:2965 length:972 start_codon:yes stop_codon:yes gene_type:complete
MKRYLALLMFILCTACEKEELAIEAHNINIIQSNQIDMGSDYSYQTFYNIETNTIISQNLKTSWNLGFESKDDGWNIIINSSVFSQISIIENNNFEDFSDLEDLDWQWDNPKGIFENTAIGDYRNLNDHFYVLDLGYDLNNNKVGYVKFKIDSVSSSSYYLTFSSLDDLQLQTSTIAKDPDYNFIYYSFESGDVIGVEPQKNMWHLSFTQYTHLFNEASTSSPYLVSGVYLNYLNDNLVAVDSTSNFSDIFFSDISRYSFLNYQNSIGYDWKNYDLQTALYSIFTHKIFIIKTNSHKYFKFRFLDFYNDNGDKGYPLFELQEL